MIKRNLSLLIFIAVFASGCRQESPVAQMNYTGHYDRKSTCQRIINQLGTTGDNIYDAEYSTDANHQRLVQLYKANGCDK